MPHPPVRAASLRRFPSGLAAACAVALSSALLAAPPPAGAAEGCEVDYTVSEWGNGFTAEVEITNLGDAVDGWALEWDFPSGQQVTGEWNAETSQSGSTVTAENVSYNAQIASGGTVSFGVQATHSGDNEAPESFALNGTVCDGSAGGGDDDDDGGGDDGGGDPSPSDEPEGWATQNGGTTGGDSANTVTVSSEGELLDALQSSESTVVRLEGSVDLSGMNDVASDKTLIGEGSDATITGGGFNLNGVSNVIIRNINFDDWDEDAIGLQEGASNVWVDHNSFGSGGDGAVDIKRESDYITVSWNRVRDHDHVMLLGHSDDHTEDIGHLRVSYHHNHFDNTFSRTPRVRFGEPVHVYNNYYDGVDTGIASTQDAGVLVEGNFFQGVDHPTRVGYGSSSDGRIELNGNAFDDSGEPESEGSVADPPYSYDLDAAEDIPGIVGDGAGTGNI